MKRKSSYQAAVLTCIVSGIIVMATACAKETQPPVVTEKTEPAQSQEQSLEQGQESGQGQGQGPHQEQGARQEQGQSQEEPSSGENLNLLQMLDYPEQYTVSKEGKLITLTADAPVIVPKVNEIPVKHVTRHKTTTEDYENWKNIITRDYGSLWGDDRTDKQPDGKEILTCATQDEKYSISFSRNAGKNKSDLLWLSQHLLQEGKNSASGSENSRLETEFVKKAETQIKSLTPKPMTLHDAQWKSLNQFVFRDETWHLEEVEEMGLYLTYVPSVDGIPVMPDLPIMAKDSTLQESGMKLSYAENGDLLSIRAGTWNYEETGENAPGFLLPFAVIAEVLEEYYVNFYQTPGAIPPKNPGGDEIPSTVSINRVQLEYAVIWDEATDKGQLIPVWNFYGNKQLEDYSLTALPPAVPPGPGLLLTIDARDGSLPFEMEHAW